MILEWMLLTLISEYIGVFGTYSDLIMIFLGAFKPEIASHLTSSTDG